MRFYAGDKGCNTRISAKGSHAEHFGGSPADAHRGGEHTNDARIEHVVALGTPHGGTRGVLPAGSAEVAPFMAWPRTLWPVQRTFFSLVYGDM